MERSLNEFALTAPQAAPAAAEPPARDRSLYGRLSIAEWLLKHRDYLLDQIQAGREVSLILADLVLITVLPTVFYGLVTGVATNSWVRILSNPIKLPLMLILTMCLCLPTLYIFASYLGSRRTFLQTAALAFTSLAIIGVVLAAFAPITWFLTFTAPGAYALHVLVNVAVFILGGFMGVAFLLQGFRRFDGGAPVRPQLAFVWAWIVLFGLVAAQMGWLFRPFFSASDVWMRPRDPAEVSVFQALARLIQGLF